MAGYKAPLDGSPLEYLSNYGYGKIFKNPLFNLSFYLIGIYFGLINYIIEKRYNADFVTEQKRIYQQKQ